MSTTCLARFRCAPIWTRRVSTLKAPDFLPESSPLPGRKRQLPGEAHATHPRARQPHNAMWDGPSGPPRVSMLVNRCSSVVCDAPHGAFTGCGWGAVYCSDGHSLAQLTRVGHDTHYLSHPLARHVPVLMTPALPPSVPPPPASPPDPLDAPHPTAP